MSDNTAEQASAVTTAVEQPPAPAANPNVKYVAFDKPLKRGAKEIEGVHLRKPGAPELRGLQIMSLIQMDTNSIQTLLPRITMPPLTPGDFGPDGVDVVDLVEMAAEVSDFLLARKKSNVFPTA